MIYRIHSNGTDYAVSAGSAGEAQGLCPGEVTAKLTDQEIEDHGIDCSAWAPLVQIMGDRRAMRAGPKRPSLSDAPDHW